MQQLGHFVESLARSIVAGPSDQLELGRMLQTLHPVQAGMASGHDKT